MELLYLVGILVGFYFGFAILVWFLREAVKFLETQKYKAKLKKLSPQIDSINIHELSSRISAIKQSYVSSNKLIERKYGIREKTEQARTIEQYIQEEATYRRSKRKKPKKTHHRRYRRYY
jgi:hypothetical protein